MVQFVVPNLKDEARDILRNTVGHDSQPGAPLGSRVNARFAQIGLDHDVEELRGDSARPSDFQQ